MEHVYLCISCDELQPERAFGRFKMKGKEYRRGYCKICASERSKSRVYEWRAETSIKKACYRLKLDYKSILIYYQSHNGLCEICGNKPTMNRLVLDHNHETGAFRGLLCSPCNRAIGFLKESQTSLQNAITYINKHSI